MTDSLRPRGTVEVQCASCGAHHWIDPLDERLPGGPFTCHGCQVDPTLAGRARAIREAAPGPERDALFAAERQALLDDIEASPDPGPCIVLPRKH